MSTEDNKAAVRRYIAAAAAKDTAAAHDELAEHWTMLGPTSPEPLDQEGAQHMQQAFFAGFPDIHPTIFEQVAEGDQVVTRLNWSGTHTGEFMGVPATGKAMTVEVVRIDRFESDKIAGSRIYFDTGSVMQQIGAV